MSRERVTQALLAAVGVVHLLPATAVVSRAAVERLYDVEVPDRDTELLLRHRAVLFGVLGADLLAAAANPSRRAGTTGMAAVGLAGFVGLAHRSGTDNRALARVDHVDRVALAALVAAAVLDRSGRAARRARPSPAGHPPVTRTT